MGQMWPPLSVKIGLELADLTAWAIRAPADASSLMPLGPGHVLGVEGGADPAVDRDHNDATRPADLAPDLLHRPLGRGLGAHPRQLVDGPLADHRPHESLALPGAAGRASGVVGVEASAHDRAVAPPAGMLPVGAAGGD